MKKYIVIEHFRKETVQALYNRFEKKGRMLPSGVKYVDSWIDEEVKTCYQLMESETLMKLKVWIEFWEDLADFEIIPVISSEEAKRKINLL